MHWESTRLIISQFVRKTFCFLCHWHLPGFTCQLLGAIMKHFFLCTSGYTSALYQQSNIFHLSSSYDEAYPSVEGISGCSPCFPCIWVLITWNDKVMSPWLLLVPTGGSSITHCANCAEDTNFTTHLSSIKTHVWNSWKLLTSFFRKTHLKPKLFNFHSACWLILKCLYVLQNSHCNDMWAVSVCSLQSNDRSSAVV